MKKPPLFELPKELGWIEIGTNSIFRILQGSVEVLFGVAIAMSSLLFRWIGGLGILAGAATIIIGVGIAYVGFADQPIVDNLSIFTSLLWLGILGIFMCKRSVTKIIVR
jgi:hypothetical protein